MHLVSGVYVSTDNYNLWPVLYVDTIYHILFRVIYIVSCFRGICFHCSLQLETCPICRSKIDKQGRSPVVVSSENSGNNTFPSRDNMPYYPEQNVIIIYCVLFQGYMFSLLTTTGDLPYLSIKDRGAGQHCGR